MMQYFGAFVVAFVVFSDSQGTAPTKNPHTFTVTEFRRVRHTLIVFYYRMPFNNGNRAVFMAAT